MSKAEEMHRYSVFIPIPLADGVEIQCTSGHLDNTMIGDGENLLRIDFIHQEQSVLDALLRELEGILSQSRTRVNAE